ncbi:hypothetical protein RND71_023322 [Anisodus tanguticus]|uniref:Uncharacterized protein n=1 Tax=Anisodus tanguticus TaxID=243964 RepID=A0AAE1V6V4_9SOLA|nr:hypothetical protein RND71_023322 [Anisodus tanguticus]
MTWTKKWDTLKSLGELSSDCTPVMYFYLGVRLRQRIQVHGSKIVVSGLRRNSLSGLLPSDLGSCTELRMLNLENNNFCGAIPATFFNLNSESFWKQEQNCTRGCQWYRISASLGPKNENFIGKGRVSALYKNPTSMPANHVSRLTTLGKPCVTGSTKKIYARDRTRDLAVPRSTATPKEEKVHGYLSWKKNVLSDSQVELVSN